MTVFDASAILAFLQRERDADIVAQHLERGGGIGAANWSEVAQKVRAAGADWPLARSILDSYPITIEPVTAADAEHAAELYTRHDGLSLGDRLCLALGARHDAEVLTADRAWQGRSRVTLIR